MYEYDDEVLEYFLAHQQQLFSEEVAETPEEAEEFLEDCMAVVCQNLKDVKDYFDEAGMDIAGMSDEDILDASEVFALPSGRFLIVEGQISEKEIQSNDRTPGGNLLCNGFTDRLQGGEYADKIRVDLAVK